MLPTSTLGSFLRAPHRAGACYLLGLLLLLLLPLAGRAQVSEGLVTDSTELRVLRQFYTTTGGGQWTNHTNWPATPAAWASATLTDAASWFGIGVNAGDVTGLYLAGNNLRGPLPAGLGQLRGLFILSLEQNALTGPLPTSLGQCTQLRQLLVDNNQLTGPLPASLGRLRQLQTLHGQLNQLTGPLPDSLGRCAQLQWLFLDHNQFSGSLPPSWGQLGQVHQLSLESNNLTGELPASWGRLTGLWLLNLHSNQLAGALPDSLGLLKGLSSLDLASNRFTGSLRVLTLLPSLYAVNASHNQFSGPLPTGLGALPNLVSLYLDYNRLSGPLPPDLGQAPRLWQLSLSNNQVSGPIPAGLLRLPTLGQLDLSNNRFTTIEDLGGATGLPAIGGVSGNQLDYTSLEHLYQAKGQSRFAGIWWNFFGLDARWQLPLPGTDSVNAQSGQPATLRARGVGGQHVYAYQWQRLVGGQWASIPGDTLLTKTWDRVTTAMAGTYRLLVHNRWFTDGAAVPAELSSPPIYVDVTPYPPLARNLPDDTNLPAKLTDPPAAPDAQAPAVAPDLNYVRVWTPRQALTQAAEAPARPPGARREEWAGVSSGGVEAVPVTQPPTLVAQLPSLEATTTTRFQYGARLRAWLTPPVTGRYTLYLSASTAGALYLSPDADPSHKQLVASCTDFTSGPRDYQRYPAKQVVPVSLQAGQAYYLEVVHRHDYGPGYASVSWRLPDGSQFGEPIAGQYLRPLVPGEGGPDASTWTVEQAAMSTQYLDGLGRPVQTVGWQASPTKHDLVQVQQYDGLGREPRQFLPYAADSTDGGFRPRGLSEQGRYYGQAPPTGPPSPQDLTQGVARTGVAFAETAFEASPLNRVVAQAAPGETWQLTGGHPVERIERPNVFADSLLRFAPGYGPTDLDPHCQGSYAPGELWGVLTRDEHGYWSAEWKDKLGQLVGKAVQTEAPGLGKGTSRRWLRTYYAYDDLQRLRFVLPPEASRRQLAAVRTLAPPPPPSGVRWEQWVNVAGTAVADVPVGRAPDQVQTLPQLELVNGDFHYGARLRAWLLPPQNGDYSFYLTGNDQAELWLSTDQDPTHKVRLVSCDQFLRDSRDYFRYPEQAVHVALRADRVYYLEVVLKQEWGPGYASVSWQLPDGTKAGQPIAGAYLSPYDPALPPPPAPGSVPLPAAGLPAAALPYLFHYRFDGRGRQIAKQVPGQDGETLVVYDQLDRPVLSQDAQQRTRKEWSWSKYDALGRIILSGLTTRADTAGQVSLQATATADTVTAHQYEQRTSQGPHYYSTTQSFPQLVQGSQFSAQGFAAGQVLSVSYYDDYDFDNNGQPEVAYDPSQDGQFAAGTAPVADALRTQGMPTRTKTRVLGVVETTDVTQPAAWLTTTTFYDERARPVQVQSTNARRGTDLLTTQLDFTGKVIQSVASHQGPGLAQPLTVREFFTYDHANRLLTARQQLPGEARPTRLDSVQYNEIGQVTRKTIGTGRLTQQVDYAYNIRGWLTSLNNPFAPDPSRLFSLSLHYEAGFTKGYEQYNGNLTGQTWRGRDGVQRAYGYVYDPLNRLLQGDFVARTGAATPSAGAWTQELDNYRLNFVSYDDNGNIATLRRRGLLQAGTSHRPKQYGAVDNLSYAYQGNRLQAVDDAVSGNQLPQPATYHGAPTSLAGDFQEGGVKLGQEYLYDANGNLTQDKNKGITGIVYNHLNLPRQIHFGQVGDSVVFRYAASGQKVAKLVYQTGKPTPQRTDYLGPYQYEQDSLKFFPHAEGRVLRFVQYDAANQPRISYQREFTLKDHLGNLRLAYRAGQVRTLLATLEQDATTHKRESQQFDSLSVSAPVAQNVGNVGGRNLAYSGQFVAKLNAGGSTPQPLGPLTQLGVQKGDTVTVTAFGYYQQPVQHGFLFSLGSFLAGLFQPAQAPPPGFEARRRKDLPLLQVGVAAGLASLPQLGNGVPKGYLRVLVFNKDSALVSQQTRQLSQAANGGYESLSQRVVLPQDGYVSAYVGNESDVDVFFDDVQVEHRPGLQVQETQYDPAGLELAGLAPPSPGIKGLNNYRFNGKEFQADLGLAWNHQDWRFFDPQLLRWHSGDPEVENGQESWTPYSFGYDNAVRYADANGRQGVPGTGGVAQGALDNEFRKVDQSVRSAYHTVANTVSNAATSVANFFTDSHEGSTDLKSRNSPGLALFNSGTNGSENHLGGRQEGPAVDVSNFPSPVPSDPAKKAITFVSKVKDVIEFVSSSFGAVAVADKVSNGKVSGAIENITGSKSEEPKSSRQDTAVLSEYRGPVSGGRTGSYQTVTRQVKVGDKKMEISRTVKINLKSQ